MIPAIVLTAGLGTRLRPLTQLCAKPAVPLAGEALARRILRSLARQGVTDAVLNLHYRPETIAAAVGDAADLGIRVRYSWEQPVVLGSAGGLRHALGLLGSPTFLAVNGDTLTDVPLAGLVDRHEESGALVTLALVPNAAPRHYGGVLVDEAGYVAGFVPRGPRAEGSFHFVGVQMVSADAVSSLDDNVPASSIGGVYDRLLQDRAIAAHVTNARFWDIGTPADYLETSLAFAAAGQGSTHGRNVAVDGDAQVVDSLLWDDVTVEDGSVLRRCIVTSGVRVPRGSRYDSTILMKTDGGLSATPL